MSMDSLSETDISDEWNKPDALSLHLENMKLVIGAEGFALWKVHAMNTSILVSQEECDIFEQKLSESYLHSMFQAWLDRQDTTWKVLYEALKKAPEPGPKIAKVIITTHKTVVENEMKRIYTHRLQPVISRDVLCSISNQETNVGVAVHSLDDLAEKLHHNADTITQRLQDSNDEFRKEVEKGVKDWKEQDLSMKTAIAENISMIKEVVEKVRKMYYTAKDHYESCSSLKMRLQTELQEAKGCYSESYFQQLGPRISRLMRLQSSKVDLLISTQKSMMILSDNIAEGETNYTKCSTLVEKDKEYLLQLCNDVKTGNGALDRVRNQLVRLKGVKQEEVDKLKTIFEASAAISVGGGVLAGVLFAVAAAATVASGGVAAPVFMAVGAATAASGGVAAPVLVAAAGGAAAAVCGGGAALSRIVSSYIRSSKSTIDEYEDQITKCSSYSKNIEELLFEIQNRYCVVPIDICEAF